MMGSQQKLAMFLAMSSILSGDQYIGPEDYLNDSLPKRKPEPKKVIRPIPKGHQKFIIEGREIWALNHKNAVKKFKKIKS